MADERRLAEHAGRRLPTPDADPYGPSTHFTMSDMRELFFNGTYPTGWQKRDWSNSTMIKNLTETVLSVPRPIPPSQTLVGQLFLPSQHRSALRPCLWYALPRRLSQGVYMYHVRLLRVWSYQPLWCLHVCQWQGAVRGAGGQVHLLRRALRQHSGRQFESPMVS